MTNPPPPTPWVPTTPEEWSEVFAAGNLKAMKQYDSERAEWEAKVNAEKQGGENNNGSDAEPLSWRERLLG